MVNNEETPMRVCGGDFNASGVGARLLYFFLTSTVGGGRSGRWRGG
jgi:hypothetical protein